MEEIRLDAWKMHGIHLHEYLQLKVMMDVQEVSLSQKKRHSNKDGVAAVESHKPI